MPGTFVKIKLKNGFTLEMSLILLPWKHKFKIEINIIEPICIEINEKVELEGKKNTRKLTS